MRGWRNGDGGDEAQTWNERLTRIRATLHEARLGVEEALAKQNEAEVRLQEVQARLEALLTEAEIEGRKHGH